EGPRVATVDAANKVSLAPVALGRDFGTEVEIVAGLRPTDRVIDTPSRRHPRRAAGARRRARGHSISRRRALIRQAVEARRVSAAFIGLVRFLASGIAVCR